MIVEVIKSELARENAADNINIISSVRGITSGLVESTFTFSDAITLYEISNPKRKVKTRPQREIQFPLGSYQHL
jgi:hypothetical protein